MLLEKNMGTHLSIDESMLHNDLFTFLSNKEGYGGKQGSLIAVTKGTTISEVTKHPAKIPEMSRLTVEEVTMDFSDSMMGITKQMFPNAEIVIDCFHIMQLAGNGLEEMRMKIKRAAVAETKKAEREFKNRQAARNKASARYAKKHKPKKGKKGKTLGRPRKRKNEKFVPAKMENDETKVELLTHVRYPLLKSANDWTDFQRKSMKILFKENKRIQRAYGLVCSPRNIFKTKQSRDKAKEALHVWYKRVGKPDKRTHCRTGHYQEQGRVRTKLLQQQIDQCCSGITQL